MKTTHHISYRIKTIQFQIIRTFVIVLTNKTKENKFKSKFKVFKFQTFYLRRNNNQQNDGNPLHFIQIESSDFINFTLSSTQFIKLIKFVLKLEILINSYICDTY